MQSSSRSHTSSSSSPPSSGSSSSSTAEEKWKRINDAPFYEISTLGRIRRIPKNVIVYAPTKRRTSEIVVLRTGERMATHFLVSQLVLDNYVLKPSKKHIYVGFRDGNKHNPVLSNVYWSDVKI